MIIEAAAGNKALRLAGQQRNATQAKFGAAKGNFGGFSLCGIE